MLRIRPNKSTTLCKTCGNK